MKTVTVHLLGTGPYSQSRLYTKSQVPPLEKESASDYDERNWRHHQHWDPETGYVYIPPMALKNALMEAAQYLSEKIPGKGNATWTKHFTAGILCAEPIPIVTPDGKRIRYDQTQCETIMCNADGKRGSGTRVPRTFPIVPQWEATAFLLIFDEVITQDVFTRYLQESGKFIGIGRFRPRNGGHYGRFDATVESWK